MPAAPVDLQSRPVAAPGRPSTRSDQARERCVHPLRTGPPTGACCAADAAAASCQREDRGVGTCRTHRRVDGARTPQASRQLQGRSRPPARRCSWRRYRLRRWSVTCPCRRAARSTRRCGEGAGFVPPHRAVSHVGDVSATAPCRGHRLHLHRAPADIVANVAKFARRPPRPMPTPPAGATPRFKRVHRRRLHLVARPGALPADVPRCARRPGLRRTAIINRSRWRHRRYASPAEAPTGRWSSTTRPVTPAARTILLRPRQAAPVMQQQSRHAPLPAQRLPLAREIDAVPDVLTKTLHRLELWVADLRRRRPGLAASELGYGCPTDGRAVRAG
jgi:hypothetical protein